MRLAVIAEIVDEAGCALYDLFLAVDLAVDHAQGVLLEPRLAVLAHAADVRSEVILQYLVVLAPARGAPDRIDVQRDVLQAHALEENIYYADDLRVYLRPRASERLQSQLVELSSSALGHLLISERRDVVEQPHGGRQRRHAVLDIRPYHACRSFGPERNAPAALVVESIHLLRNDVRCISHAPLEQIRLLKGRDPYLFIAEAVADVREHPLRLLPLVNICRQDIACTLLCTVSHRSTPYFIRTRVIIRQEGGFNNLFAGGVL